MAKYSPLCLFFYFTSFVLLVTAASISNGYIKYDYQSVSIRPDGVSDLVNPVNRTDSNYTLQLGFFRSKMLYNALQITNYTKDSEKVSFSAAANAVDRGLGDCKKFIDAHKTNQAFLILSIVVSFILTVVFLIITIKPVEGVFKASIAFRALQIVFLVFVSISMILIFCIDYNSWCGKKAIHLPDTKANLSSSVFNTFMGSEIKLGVGALLVIITCGFALLVPFAPWWEDRVVYKSLPTYDEAENKKKPAHVQEF